MTRSALNYLSLLWWSTPGRSFISDGVLELARIIQMLRASVIDLANLPFAGSFWIVRECVLTRAAMLR